MRQTIATAQDQLQLARDVYAGVNEFSSFDPDTYLQRAREQLQQELPLASEAAGLAGNLRQGLRGGSFNGANMVQRLDLYGDHARRRNNGWGTQGPAAAYNYSSALGIASDLDQVARDRRFQDEASSRPSVATAADGVLHYEALQADPQLVVLLSKRRAEAAASERQATELYFESLGASPGKAAQLSAQANSRSAMELARVNDHLAKAETRQQLQDLKAAQEEASARQGLDNLFNAFDTSIERSFQPRTKAAPPGINIR
ncbi:hypothetical protein [Myxococcus vastator]|uniref:hypothetical protein n=1 Tax=Myxococcus vastator TaxID=2709664 RepID=UPI0013D4C3E7|nr:hypothetical protein [Myxococcus vastator]